MVQKGSQKSSVYQQYSKKLTKTEEEVMRLLCEQFLTPKQISIRRQTTERATYKVIENLKKKGAINKTFKKVHKIDTTCELFGKKVNHIRLHGLQVRFNILYKDERYKKLLTKANIIDIDGNTIKLYKDTIIIYVNKEFYSEGIEKCTQEGINYINRLARTIENDINITITQPRKQNIKILMAHYAEINNEFAKELNIKAEKIKVYTRDDNKLWFLIDNSFNLHEAECLHPETNYNDMENIKKFFNDLRENPTTMTEIMDLMKKQIKINTETAAGLNTVVKFIQTQIPREDKQQTNLPNYIQ